VSSTEGIVMKTVMQGNPLRSFASMWFLAWAFFACSLPVVTESQFEKKKGYPDGVTMSQPTLKISTDSTGQLTASVIGGSAEYAALVWTSASPYIATVDDDGLVTPAHPGSTIITVETVYGKRTASCHVTVEQAGLVKGLSIEPSLSLDVNEDMGNLSAPLTAVFTPENATNKGLSWHTNN